MKLFSILCRLIFLTILFKIIQPTCVYAQIESQFGYPNLLLGKTGAANTSTIDSASYNPAQAAKIKDNHIQATLGLQWLDYSYQYPGHAANSTSSIGLDGYPVPKVAWKINPNLVIAGTVIPFPIGVDIKAKGLPMVIFGQVNHVDINGKGKLNGYLDCILGYSLSSKLSLGLALKYTGFQGDGKLNSEGKTGDGIASFSVKGTTIEVKVGAKYRLNARLTLGGAVSLYTMSKQESEFATALDSVGEDSKEPEKNIADDSMPLKQARFGVGFRALKKLLLFGDVEYVRANKGQTQFSIVDFKIKEKEVADTVSAYIGAEYNWQQNRQFLAGAYYEPSSVGQGSGGADGQAGFGFLDVALALGDPPSRPHWALAVGIREHFMKKHIRIKGKKYARYMLITEAGLVFDRTSIGIDENGEQPSAYVVNRVKIPIKVKYSF